jgi:hypothetical protein
MVLQFTGTSWVGVGWRPTDIDASTCSAVPMWGHQGTISLDGPNAASADARPEPQPAIAVHPTEPPQQSTTLLSIGLGGAENFGMCLILQTRLYFQQHCRSQSVIPTDRQLLAYSRTPLTYLYRQRVLVINNSNCHSYHHGNRRSTEWSTVSTRRT